LGTPGNVTVIDVRGFYAASADEQKQWMEALQSLLNRNDVVWAGHNIKFDWSFLAVHFGVRLQNVYDTMLVEKLIHNGEKVSASLLNTASRYGIRITKEERNWFIALDKREEWYQPLPIGQMAYIIQDIEVPHQVIEKQQESIGRFDLERVIALENAALPAVAAMEVHGIVVDAERWKGILATKMGRKEVLEAELTDVLGSALADKAEQDTDGKLFSVRPGNKINLASSDQLVKALAVVGIHVVDAKSETLEEKRDDHAIVSQLLEWKELQKFVSSFGLKLLEKVEPDGRIHANFDQLGARSGRFSCSSPNLQQVPKPKDDDSNLRSCFVAPVDHQLLVADLSNIELRILADLSKDSTMLRFFAEGKDLHSETARLMFNLGPDIDPKTHKINGLKARDIAKTINFGLAYGMGTTGLAASLGVDLETAKELMNSYFATYRGVAKFLDRAGQKGADLGYTRSLSGRRRTFTAKELSPENRWHAVNASKNHPIQGTNADILKRALALLDERLPQGVYIVLTVHDEIVLESPIGLVENAENALKTCMLEACRDFLKSVTIPEIDVLVASHWVKG
jgi:DNA polymerase-1